MSEAGEVSGEVFVVANVVVKVRSGYEDYDVIREGVEGQG